MYVGIAPICVLVASLAWPGSTRAASAPAIEAQCGELPVALAIGDVNGDGRPDLVTANRTGMTVTILIAESDGGFLRAGDIALGLYSYVPAVACADVTGDGVPDLLIGVNDNALIDSVRVYRGDGTGQFDSLASVPVGIGINDIAVSDLDRDGLVDWVATCTSSSAAYVALNGANGVGWLVTSATTGGYPEGVAIADVDRDGDADITVACAIASSVSVLGNDGQGHFLTRTDYPAGYGAADVCVADFTGDQWPDLAVTDYDLWAVSFLIGSATGFSAPHAYGTKPYPSGIASGEFTGDEIPDAVVTSQGYYSNEWSTPVQSTVAVFSHAGGDSFRFVQAVTTGSDPHSPVVADFNLDQKDDVATVNARSNTVTVWHQQSLGSGFVVADTVVGAEPVDIKLGNLNGDGLPDAVVVNGYGNSVSVLLGTSDGGFSHGADLTTALSPSGVALADVSGDGALDCVVACAASNLIQTFLGNGAGGFSPPAQFDVGAGPRALAVGDLNEDGKLDVVTSNSGTYDFGCDCYTNGNSLSVLLGNGAGGFGSRVDVPTPSGPGAVAITRVTSDAHADVVLLTPGQYRSGCECFNGANDVSVYVGNGLGGFSSRKDTNLGVRPIAFVAAQLRGSPAPDLLVAHVGEWDLTCNCYLGGLMWSLVGLGNGAFTVDTTFFVCAEPTDLALADINRDGLADLAVTSFAGNSISVAFGTKPGRFGTAQGYGVGSSPLALACGDLGADSLMDVVVANSQSNSVTLLRNALSAPTGIEERATDVTAGGTLRVSATRDGRQVRLAAQTAPHAEILVRVLDVRGRVIWASSTVADGYGQVNVRWAGLDNDGRRVASGMYVCRLTDSRAEGEARVVLLH